MSKPQNYKVQKNRPLPTAGRSFGNFLPFKEMEVGDSFTFATVDEKRVTAAAEAYGKKNGAAFFINMGGNDGNSCWRTA